MVLIKFVPVKPLSGGYARRSPKSALQTVCSLQVVDYSWNSNMAAILSMPFTEQQAATFDFPIEQLILKAHKI